jgi:hypothetical protein
MEKELLMKPLPIAIASFVVLALSFAITPVARAQNPDVKTILKDVSPEDLAKAFATDPAAAKTEYDAKGPKGGAGGTGINISGQVEMKRNAVYFKVESPFKIQLDNAPLPKGPGKFSGVLKSTTFVRYDSRTKTIHLDGSGIKYGPFLDD